MQLKDPHNRLWLAGSRSHSTCHVQRLRMTRKTQLSLLCFRSNLRVWNYLKYLRTISFNSLASISCTFRFHSQQSPALSPALSLPLSLSLSLPLSLAHSLPHSVRVSHVAWLPIAPAASVANRFYAMPNMCSELFTR